MFEILQETKDDVIAFTVKGKVEKEDYDKLNALIDKTIREFDLLKLYIEVHEIKGMEPSALWEDIKTYVKNVTKISKVAVVGKNGFEKLITKAANPFHSAEIKYFPAAEMTFAKQWVMV